MENENILNDLEHKIQSNIFKDKHYLTERYIPEIIPHRKNEIEKIKNCLIPVFRGEKANNLMLYGPSGTGKTLVVKYIKDVFEKLAIKKSIPLKIIYLNCKLGESDTEYKAMINICSGLGGSIKFGLNSAFLYKEVFELLDYQKNVIIIFDEINYLINKSGDNILYTFSRIDSELKNCYVNSIGISNDFRIMESVDSSIASSLSEISIPFPTYNAPQLKDIILQRIDKAFYPNVVGDSVINKSAALGAQIGDAKKSLNLLRLSGEIAEMNDKIKIVEKNLDEAEIMLEKNQIMDLVKQLSQSNKIVLSSIIKLLILGKDNTNHVCTGEVYVIYIDICKKIGLRPTIQSGVSNIISELDLLGIITSKIHSKGRYGRVREIRMYLDNKIILYIQEYLESNLLLESTIK